MWEMMGRMGRVGKDRSWATNHSHDSLSPAGNGSCRSSPPVAGVVGVAAMTGGVPVGTKNTTMHLSTKPAEHPIVLDYGGIHGIHGSYGWHGSDRDRLSSSANHRILSYPIHRFAPNC